MTKRLAIVGRPNVGKSTLFNRVAGKKLAIVDDTPGVTRDWKEAPAHLGDLSFIAVDTAGIEDIARGTAKDSIAAGMRRQTETALKAADAVLFVIDGQEGVTGLDQNIAELLRKMDLPIVLVANKCESGKQIVDAYGLGFGEPVPISAVHGDGMADLYDALEPYLMSIEDEDEDEEDDSDKPLRMAFVGRPNAGKSTLLNALLGEERALVSPVAGTTRDTIAAKWEFRGRPVRLVDTAGLRRKARIDHRLEKMAIAETLRIIRLAELVVLVCDATEAMEHQDLAIADLVLREGRSLVIALNKWDKVENPAAVIEEMRARADESLTQARGIPMVPISALKGRKLDTLMASVLSIHEKWDTRVTTGQLNKWLEAMTESHPPPLVSGRRVKIRYVTQRKSRPPTFVLFCGTHAEPPESYLRYLVNGLRQRFELDGVPIRLEIKRSKNPYAEDGETPAPKKPSPRQRRTMAKRPAHPYIPPSERLLSASAEGATPAAAPVRARKPAVKKPTAGKAVAKPKAAKATPGGVKKSATPKVGAAKPKPKPKPKPLRTSKPKAGTKAPSRRPNARPPRPTKH